jgi:hypothetical protein
VLKNRISLIVVKCIFINGKAIPPLIIILSVLIKEIWFYKNISGYKVITISLTKYINKGICIV